jgi:DNA topoisomerase-1
MSKILVIIESPGKVQKIQSILGPNYIVKPTVGHITHIQRKPFGINLDNFDATYLLNTSRSECKGKDDK